MARDDKFVLTNFSATKKLGNFGVNVIFGKPEQIPHWDLVSMEFYENGYFWFHVLVVYLIEIVYTERKMVFLPRIEKKKEFIK